MGEAVIEASNWRHVEVGRVVLISEGHPCAGRIAVIVEIIDHKRVCDWIMFFPEREIALANSHGWMVY